MPFQPGVVSVSGWCHILDVHFLVPEIRVRVKETTARGFPGNGFSVLLIRVAGGGDGGCCGNAM